MGEVSPLLLRAVLDELGQVLIDLGQQFLFGSRILPR